MYRYTIHMYTHTHAYIICTHTHAHTQVDGVDIRRFDTSDIMSMILGQSNTTVSLGFLRPNGLFYDVIVILLLHMRPRNTYYINRCRRAYTIPPILNERDERSSIYFCVSLFNDMHLKRQYCVP